MSANAEPSETAPLAQSDTQAHDDSMPPNETSALSAAEVKVVVPQEKAHEMEEPTASVRPASEFCGLNKEELAKYANDPFWVRLRWGLLVLFWVLWLSLLVGAITVIATTNKCVASRKLAWYQSGAVYAVSPARFQDSDSDGKGDLQGLISKLDYLKNLGVKTLLLAKDIFPAIPADQKNDTFSQNIDPSIGTLADFDRLLKHSKTHDLRVVLDMDVARITTDAVSKFWLKRGVAGFRLSGDSLSPDVVQMWRNASEAFENNDGSDRVLMIEAAGSEPYSWFGFNSSEQLVDVVSRSIPSFGTASTGQQINDAVEDLLNDLPEHGWLSLQTGARDATLLIGEVDVLNTLLITLPGTPILAAGDEVGSTEDFIQTSTAEGQLDNSTSHLKLVISLLKMRAEHPSLRGGNFTSVLAKTQIFSFLRVDGENPACLVVLNLGGAAELLTELPAKLPTEMSSSRAELLFTTSAGNPAAVGTQLSLAKLQLSAHSALVLKLLPVEE